MAIYYVDGSAGNDSASGTSTGSSAWATIAKAFATAAAGDVVEIKASVTYTQTATLTFSASGSANNQITFRGYSTNPGDGGRVSVTTATNSLLLLDGNGKNGITLDGFNFSNTAGTPAAGFQSTAGFLISWVIENCSFNGFTYGLVNDQNFSYVFQSSVIIGCTFTDCSTAGASLACNSVDNLIRNCLFQGCYDGLRLWSPFPSMDTCVFYNNTNHGLIFETGSGYLRASRCAFVSNAADGIHINDQTSVSPASVLVLENNIFYGNAGKGVNSATAVNWSYAANRCNAYGSNTGGARNNVVVGTGDVSLTASPFTNPSGSNFALNSTAGGGPLCKAAGWPGVAPFGTGYTDIGPLQSQASGGGGGRQPKFIHVGS
jgi:hypothetical protein